MIERIKPGGLYWADVDGKAAKIRAIERSRELPHLWLCAGPNGKYILVHDCDFHRVDGASGDHACSASGE
jgi:hypothetical protein